MARFIAFVSLLFVFGISVVQATPKIESWTNANGAKVMFVRADALPMLDIRVVFDAGSARDGEEYGIATFVNALLSEGAGDMSADDIAVRLENRGIEMGNGALRDMAWVTVRSLTDKAVMDVAIATLADVLGKPSFEEKAVERIRQQLRIAIRSATQSPSHVAKKRFLSTLYGDHPYAHHPTGEDETVKKITVEGLQDFHQQYYVAENAVVSIVGKVTREEAEDIANRVTAKLKRGSHAVKVDPPEARNGGELRETFPSSQSHIYVGQLGMARHDKDYFPLYVGNHVLGGGSLVSVLGEEVRNKRGLSYSVYSYFSPMRATGPFLMVAQTKNSQAGEALEVIRDTLKNFMDKGPEREDLERAKKNIIGSFPLRIDSNKEIVEYIAMIGFYDLPLDWLATLQDKVRAVKAIDVWTAFKKRIDPKNHVAVIVGGKD